MTTLFWLKDLLDFLGGVHDSPPEGAPRLLRNPLFRGLWWGLLLTLDRDFFRTDFEVYLH